MRRHLTFLTVGILFVLLFHPVMVSSQGIHPVKDGPIHEAFVPKVQGNVILDAVRYDPPQPVIETPPPQQGRETVWIPGYWTWSELWNDFIWVSGVWRRPPPGHHWIPGFWRKFNNEWVKIPGFWSAESQKHLFYIHTPPPDPIDEDVTPPPSSDYFWNPGYWLFNPTLSKYEWVPGSWEPFDPNWILVPAHYIWRPDGYVLIPAYWDRHFDDIGVAYENIFIEPRDRPGASFEPSRSIEEAAVIEQCFLYYPDYLCFFFHHYHFHPTFWKDFCCAPTWWQWETWWCLPWQQQWGMWWWYCHPGYPQPHWMTGKYTAMIAKPLPELFNLMKEVEPPKIVTPNGVVSPRKLINTITRLTHQPRPIYPLKPTTQEELVSLVKPERVVNILRPSGQREPAISPDAPQKPLIDPDQFREISKASDFLIPLLPRKPLPPIQRPIYHSPLTPQAPRPPIHRPLPTRRPLLPPGPPTVTPPRPQPPVYRPPSRPIPPPQHPPSMTPIPPPTSGQTTVPPAAAPPIYYRPPSRTEPPQPTR